MNFRSSIADMISMAALTPISDAALAASIEAKYLGRSLPVSLQVSPENGEPRYLGGGLFRFEIKNGPADDPTGLFGDKAAEFVAICIDPHEGVKKKAAYSCPCTHPARVAWSRARRNLGLPTTEQVMPELRSLTPFS